MKKLGAALISILLIAAGPAAGEVREDDINLSSTAPPYDEVLAKGFQPRPDVSPWPVSFPLDWEADPFGDQNWRFQLHAWRIMDSALKSYFRSSDPKYFAAAVSIALDWRRYYDSHQPGRFTWDDMATGIRAMRLAFILDKVLSGKMAVTVEDRQVLLDMADEHARRLQDEHFIAMSNHGLFQVFGLDLLCSVLEDRQSCNDGRAFAARMFAKLVDKQFTPEGVHKEHSPSYHRFVATTLDRLTRDQFKALPDYARVEKARELFPWFVFPNGRVAAVGDSEGEGDPLAVADNVRCLSSGDCYSVGDFTKSGYAVVRSAGGSAKDASMLFVSGMAYSTGHKHADDLGFELFENGRMLIVDSGKYGYAQDDMRRYVLSAAAHNTIGIENTTVEPGDVRRNGSQLTAVSAVADAFNISGAVNRPGLFRQRRTLSYAPGRLLVVKDRLRAHSSLNYVSSLHLAPGLRPTMTTRGFEVRENGRRLMAATLQEDDCRIETVEGQRNPINGWVSVGYLDMVPAPVVMAVCPGRDRTITWRIQLTSSED